MKNRPVLQQLQPRSGVQIYPTPSVVSQDRRGDLSLFQQCSLVRSRLSRDPVFARYLARVAPASSHHMPDPVSHLWDCFSLGISLCHLYNCIPGNPMFLPVSTEPSKLDAASDIEAVKHDALATFVRHVAVLEPEWRDLSVTDIVNDRVELDGFIKFLNVVDAILDLLPDHLFGDRWIAPTITGSVTTTGREQLERMVVQQLLLSERGYVKNLERMKEYADHLRQHVDPHIVDRLFPSCNRLVNFQRWFLIHVEAIADRNSQNLGSLFVNNEAGFAQVYAPYCANIVSAADLMLAEEERLQPLNSVIDFWEELPGLIVKPLHRIHSYPIILENLMRATLQNDAMSYRETELGFLAMSRVSTKVNEGQRRTATSTTVNSLRRRVRDWAGLVLDDFGDLLLVDVLSVTANGTSSERHVFLFKMVVVCFSEALEQPKKASHGRADTMLVVQGHVWLSDMVFAAPTTSPERNEYLLNISWLENDKPTRLMLGFRNEHQLTQWHTSLFQLIDDIGHAEVPATAEDELIPELHVVEPEPDPPSRALSMRSHNTQNSADEHVISYYFGGLLSPTNASARDMAFSLRSDDSLHDSEFKSILSAYGQGNSSSPVSVGSSPGSRHSPLSENLSSRNASPVLHADEAQYRKDVAFMQSLLKQEEEIDAKPPVSENAVVQTLDFMQEVLDRVDTSVRMGWLSEAQVAEAGVLQQATRRAMLKLARESSTLPSSLFVTDVYIPRIDRAIALGGFADIFLGTYRGQSVAVKRLRMSDDQEAVQLMIWKEALIWRQLRHPYIMQFIGVDRNTFGHTCLVSPWLPHGNIMSYMDRQGPNNVEVDRLLLEVAEGVAYLHTQGVIHGDLRGSNILIDSSHHPRLSDFGLGTFSNSSVGSHTSKGGGSIRWMAPELLKPHEMEFRRTFATDVYSYGCVCVELYTCTHPYHEMPHDVQVLFHVLSGGRPARPSREACPGHRMPYSVWDLAQKCWSTDAAHRPTIGEVVDSLQSFLQGVGGL